MNKREIFDKIIDHIISGKFEVNVKMTEKEDFICYTFGREPGYLDNIKAIIKQYGYKQEAYIAWDKNRSPLSTNKLCVLYDKKRDRISVKYLNTGWNYAENKGRFYPIKKVNRIFCYSGKHIYIQNSKHIKIRHMRSNEYFLCAYDSFMLTAILNRPECPEPICVRVPMRYCIGAKTNKDILDNYFNINTIYNVPLLFDPNSTLIDRDIWAYTNGYTDDVNPHFKAQKALECFLELHEINKTMRRKISVKIKTNTHTPEELGLYKLVDKGRK